MSDLRPMLLPRRLASELPQGGDALHEATQRLAYPFAKILPSAPLAFYFEAYHLGFDPETDQTRYTVAYEVQRRTEAGGLRGLFGGEDEQRTTTEATYSGHAPIARELVMIDLSEAAGAEPGSELVVTVRVADEVSGQTVERRVAFEVAAAPGVATRQEQEEAGEADEDR